MKYNTIVRIQRYRNEGQEWVNLSFVTPDHQEHELVILADGFDWSTTMPAEYLTYPACCDHPDGCPNETNTEKLLKYFNEKEGA